MRILIVDDDVTILSFVRDYLRGKTYDVTVTESGLQALKLLRTEIFDLLLTDIVVPDVSGVGLIRIVRKEFPGLPVIAMTGFGRKVEGLVRETDVDWFLEKPFDLQALDEGIQHIARRSEGRTEGSCAAEPNRQS